MLQQMENIRQGLVVFRVFAVFLAAIVLCGCDMLEGNRVRDDVWLGNTNVGGYKRRELESAVRALADSTYVEPEDAVLDDKKWVVIRAEKYGRQVNIEKTIEAVLNAQKGERVEPVVEPVEPLVTADLLMANIVEVARYSTPLLDKSPNRINNISLAAEKIDYAQLEPGEEFSFNRVVGKRTVAGGFEEAPIIIETPEGAKTENEVGGGICQVVTTLYNAARQGGFEITERHPHSGYVAYAPKGQDATVYYGEIDFRFKNNRSYPVMMRVVMEENSVTVKILENRNYNLGTESGNK